MIELQSGKLFPTDCRLKLQHVEVTTPVLSMRFLKRHLHVLKNQFREHVDFLLET